MSSTNRGTERLPDDAYMTPKWCVKRLLDVWRPNFGTLVEPAVGIGNIVDVVRDRVSYPWLTYDINDSKNPNGVPFTCVNFLTLTEQNPEVSAVITNPPYSLAEQFIKHCNYLYPNAEIVMLLRLAFLASAKRKPLWDLVGVPDVFVLPNRPSFTNGGTDSTDYAWFVFNGVNKEGVLKILPTTPASERK